MRAVGTFMLALVSGAKEDAMTLPATSLIRAARAASRLMADRTTPFIFNEWYVAAFADEIGRTLLKRKILGRNLVLFRTAAGKPVALEDRCAHRSFPLSASKLDGDTIICGYHGLRYDADGNCIEVPSQRTCPKGIGVAGFPLVERGPLTWIWMGAPELADSHKIPHQPWLEAPGWERSRGYFALPASYVSLHENLLDLTHLSYLHAGSFGTADYASAPYEVVIEDDAEAHARGAHPRFLLNRHVVPTKLPPVWANPTRISGNTAARIVSSEFVSPALHVVTVRFHDTALPADHRPEFEVRTAHIPTPETLTSTHYFIVHGRDFAREDPAVTGFMHDKLFAAFAEDVAGLTAIEQTLAATGDDAYEISIASDRAAVAMRRYLKRRSDHEHSRGGYPVGDAQPGETAA
jgi:phenylpropionate dioxygenase-like ring-hydroxylating dioxygenase large terminal subunit